MIRASYRTEKFFFFGGILPNLLTSVAVEVRRPVLSVPENDPLDSDFRDFGRKMLYLHVPRTSLSFSIIPAVS